MILNSSKSRHKITSSNHAVNQIYYFLLQHFWGDRKQDFIRIFPKYPIIFRYFLFLLPSSEIMFS